MERLKNFNLYDSMESPELPANYVNSRFAFAMV